MVNHGVSIELLELLKTSAHEFFAQPPEKKAIYLKEVSPNKLVKYGTSFVPEKEKAIEWKDYVSMLYTNDHEALQHWPQPCRYICTKKVYYKYIKVVLIKKDINTSKLCVIQVEHAILN